MILQTDGIFITPARIIVACRRMKHLDLPRAHRDRLVSVILDRLVSGNFSEQFRDQLRLAMQLDHRRSFIAANKAIAGDREYVRRLGKWVLSHLRT